MLLKEEGYSTTSGALYPRGRVLTSWCTLCTPGPSVPHTSCLSRALPAPNLTCGSLYSLHRELEYRYQQMSLVIVNFTPYHLQWSPIHLSIHSVLSVKMVISYQHLKRSCSNISENNSKMEFIRNEII